MVTAAITSHRNVLKNISWETFEKILAEIGEDRLSRLTYDRGTLEIMTPLLPHEHNNRLIHNLVVILAEELNLNLKSVGSLTCKRPDRQRGGEPDSGFYIQNEPLVRSKEQIDLAVDPPPDLVVEVDVTSSSLDRLSIYADIGAPELWRYDEPVLQIYLLQSGQYVPCDVSPTFAGLPLALEIPRFLKQSLRIGEIPMIKSFRTWVREQVAGQ